MLANYLYIFHQLSPFVNGENVNMIGLIIFVLVFVLIAIWLICLHKCELRDNNSRRQTQEQQELQLRELEDQLYNLNII